MKKLMILLLIFAACYAAGHDAPAPAAEQTALPETEPAAVYEITLPSPQEAGSQLKTIGDALHALFSSFSIEKQPLPEGQTGNQVHIRVQE